MEESQENVKTENLAAAAAAATAVVESSDVRGSESDTQKGGDVIKEGHDGLVKGSDSGIGKGGVEEETGIYSCVVVTENVVVVEDEVISVEEKQEVVNEAESDGELNGQIDRSDGSVVVTVTKSVVETEVVSVKIREQVQDVDGLEGVGAAEMEIDSGLGAENVEQNAVQKVGEQEMNVNGEKSDNSDEEDVGEHDHGFAVGDFVWGKIKSYPWWPGQIYDPSDASDYAEEQRKRTVKGRHLLVAYFGDGSFSWCRKSQLKRFAENFDVMSRQSNSKNFLNAVAEALDEFSRAVEVEISCMSLPSENHIGDSKARNRGVKEGVTVPRGDNLKLFVTRLEPRDLLENLRNAAKTGSVAGSLELRVLKSWLAAFYRRKRGFGLAKFPEPIPIEGLEDKMGNGVNGKADFSEGVIIPNQGPAEEDWTTVRTSEDKVYQRKQKSVAEIMEEDMVGIELMHSKESMDRSNKKMRKGDYGGENGSNSSVKNSSGKRGRKRKAETKTRSPESVQNGDLEKDKTDGTEETLRSFASRERKKSKYLSPPYTTRVTTSSKLGERMTRVAGQLIGSPPILTSCSNQLNKKRSKQVDSAIDVNEVLSVITDVAVDPMHSRGKKNLDQITGFVSAFRSSVYSDGSAGAAAGRKTKSKEGEATLLITFPPAFTLPSKDDLLEMFGEYGEIYETETDVFSNSFSARVAFVRNSDAEEAHSECLKNSPFGDANVNYRLLYPGRKASSVYKKTAESESTDLGLIRQKLENLASDIESWDGQVTEKKKRKLEGELKDLVADVSILPVSSTQ